MAAPLRLAPKFIDIDRDAFRLTVWRMKRGHYGRERRYEIATGRVGRQTPPGAYFIEGRARKPDWLIPDRPEYTELREKWQPQEHIVPFEHSDNPFTGGFLSLSGGQGLGIHGTKADPQVGTQASAGCIRMDTAPLLDLWRRVADHTPVFIH